VFFSVQPVEVVLRNMHVHQHQRLGTPFARGGPMNRANEPDCSEKHEKYGPVNEACMPTAALFCIQKQNLVSTACRLGRIEDAAVGVDLKEKYVA
jgi:hypothetical protein